MFGKPVFGLLPKSPSKYLLGFRCASKLSVHGKQVTKDPTPIIFYLSRNYKLAKPPFFHALKPDTRNTNVFQAKKKVGVLEFVSKKLLKKTSYIVGYCNGLVIIKTGDYNVMPTFIVIHPINKKSYVLPQLPSILCSNHVIDGHVGLVLIPPPTLLRWCACIRTQTALVVIASWCMYLALTVLMPLNTQVPAHPIFGKAIFAHGCLHWVAAGYHSEDGARQVIWFDVKDEEFGLIKPPKRNDTDPFHGDLVNLDGQVGYFGGYTTVWLLNDKKEWMLHYDFKDYEFDHDGYISVVGCLNKDGDILIKGTNWRTGQECIYIYNLKNRVLHSACIHGLDLEDGCKTEIVILPNSLCDITTNSNLFKKKSLKKTRSVFGRFKKKSLKKT